MDLWIRFIGLILFYQAHSGAPYQVLIPKWEHDNICETTIIEHAPFIRIPHSAVNVVDASQWPERRECNPDQHCTLFRIPDGSTLTIEPGFKSARRHPDKLPCLIPDFGRENLVPTPRLHPDAFTRSAVDYTLPNGGFVVRQFKSNAMYVKLDVPAPTGARREDIRIVASARPGTSGTRRVLVVRPGTRIDVLNVPPTHAVMSDDVVETDADLVKALERHFFFLHKLLDVTAAEDKCKPFPNVAQGACIGPRARVQKPGPTATHTLGCGPGTLVGTADTAQ